MIPHRQVVHTTQSPTSDMRGGAGGGGGVEVDGMGGGGGEGGDLEKGVARL